MYLSLDNFLAQQAPGFAGGHAFRVSQFRPSIQSSHFICLPPNGIFLVYFFRLTFFLQALHHLVGFMFHPPRLTNLQEYIALLLALVTNTMQVL